MAEEENKSSAAQDEEPSSKERKPERRRTIKLIVLTAIVAAVVTGAVVALLINIFEHKQEARNPFYRVVELTDETTDPPSGAKISRYSTTAIAARSIRFARASAAVRLCPELQRRRTRAP